MTYWPMDVGYSVEDIWSRLVLHNCCCTNWIGLSYSINFFCGVLCDPVMLNKSHPSFGYPTTVVSTSVYFTLRSYYRSTHIIQQLYPNNIPLILVSLAEQKGISCVISIIYKARVKLRYNGCPKYFYFGYHLLYFWARPVSHFIKSRLLATQWLQKS